MSACSAVSSGLRSHTREELYARRSDVTNSRDASVLHSQVTVATELPVFLFNILDEIVFRFLNELLWNAFQRSPFWMQYWQFVALSQREVTKDDFQILNVIERGGFGMVYKCKHTSTGKLFAMKEMNKKRVKLLRCEYSCLSERKLLVDINSPFVVQLKYAYTTPTAIFLIMDLMTGGMGS